MLRFLGLLIAFLFLVPLLRSLLGFLARLFTSWSLGGDQARGSASPRQVPAGGVLRKDPVCGTYVSEQVALKTVDGGATYYFCSEECRKKYAKGT